MTKAVSALAIVALTFSSALAQDAALHKRISVDYRNAAVTDVLKDIANKAGVRFDCPPGLTANVDRVIYASEDREAGRIVTRILRPRGLTIETNGGAVVRVVSLDPLAPYRPQLEQVFEFAERPSVTRKGDTITISFETEGFCDATVAIENMKGKIIRHLASGVLGPNAPEPFQWNSKKQVVVWDGKDDFGVYVDDKDQVRIRVSLGLKTRFERQFLWSPHRRYADATPVVCATPEGVYVCEGRGVDFIRLFDHDGDYVRTVYPFPANKIGRVKGLHMRTHFQDGKALPLKLGYEQASLLSSGSSGYSPLIRSGRCYKGPHHGGYAATAMAIHHRPGSKGPGRIALAGHGLNRLATDGSTGGLPLRGPEVSFPVRPGVKGSKMAMPTSIAFSPDGKTLYLTGYVWKTKFTYFSDCFHAVLRMSYEGNERPRVFLGALKRDDGYGAGNDRFCVPLSVACDKAGRVYVADFGNNRIQVFSATGTYLKTIPTTRPAKVVIDPRTQEIRAFSWGAIGPSARV